MSREVSQEWQVLEPVGAPAWWGEHNHTRSHGGGTPSAHRETSIFWGWGLSLEARGQEGTVTLTPGTPYGTAGIRRQGLCTFPAEPQGLTWG